MDKIEFIEKYCVVKDKHNNKVYKIHLKDYQKKFINLLKYNKD